MNLKDITNKVKAKVLQFKPRYDTEDDWDRQRKLKHKQNIKELIKKYYLDDASKLKKVIQKHDKKTSDDIQFLLFNKDTPTEVLKNIIKAGPSHYDLDIAESYTTPPEVLKELVKHPDEFIRAGIAKNKNTPTEVLKELAKDKSKKVREKLAKNKKTPIEALEKLSEDKDEDVSYEAKDTLKRLKKVSHTDLVNQVKAKLNKEAGDMEFKSKKVDLHGFHDRMEEKYIDTLKEKWGLKKIDTSELDWDWGEVELKWRVNLPRSSGVLNIQIIIPDQLFSIKGNVTYIDENDKEHEFDFDDDFEVKDLKADYRDLKVKDDIFPRTIMYDLKEVRFG